MKKLLLIVLLIVLLPLSAIASDFNWHGSRWKTKEAYRRAYSANKVADARIATYIQRVGDEDYGN